MSLHDIYQQYHDQVQFLTIYIREAHPKDGWWFGGGLMGQMLKRAIPKTATDIDDPKSIEERREVARQCEQTLQYGMRTYVDEMDDAVSKAYAAKPTRLYLVGIDGRVVYAGGPGPYGFSPAALKAAIENYLESEKLETQSEPLTGD